jgi:hypothetical protein
MTQLLRITGFLLIVAGAIVVLTWLIEPLRQIWPWLLQLPIPIRIGFGLAGVGLVVILASLIWERWNEREEDRSLLDD